MGTKKKRRSDGELKEASYHIHYEKWMMVSTANALSLGTFGSGNPAANAVLESFLTHMRNLIDFLYAKNHGAKNDWILAEDYFYDKEEEWRQKRGDITALLSESRKRADKELAHLSYDRLKLTEKNKKWDFIKIATELDNGLKTFAMFVSEELLHDVWSNHLKQIKMRHK
jgi:hypothetical protein